MRHRINSMLVLAVLVSGLLLGQTYTGSISGIVTDATGALAVDVSVVVTDIDKNAAFKTFTNQTGYYLVPALPPGNYRVEAEKVGFRHFSLEPLPLSTQQKATLDIRLQVGSLTQNVTVTGEAQLVEANTAALGGVVENKRIVDLPLNGRNILQLASLVPGVFTARQLSGTDSSTAVRYFVNGGQESTGEILLDGVTMVVGSAVNGTTGVSASPSVDSIQEFRIQTNGYSAEYGHSGAGIITMVTKSGTNTFHGSAYEFLRNSAMDSNNFFANRSGLPLTSFKRNQFGASLGGPVRLPKIYDGHNRTFFFADYEGLRLRSPELVQQTVPTAAEKLGDFSGLRNPDGSLRVIYDPFSTRPDPTRPANSGINIRDPLAGNRVPVARMNPVSLAAQKYYPDPNRPGSGETHQNNYLAQGPAAQQQDRGEFKIDHAFNDRQRVFGRLSLMNINAGSGNYWGNVANPTSWPTTGTYRNLALDYTHTLSNVTLLNIRYGGGLGKSDSSPWSWGFKPSSLGLPASIDAVADALLFPPMEIQDYTNVGPTGNYSKTSSYNHSLIANLSRLSGRHSLKAGIDFRFQYVNSTALNYPVGRYNYNNGWTRGPRPDLATASGAGYASFLFGTLNTAQLGKEPNLANGSKYFGSFFQDDFKVSSKLSLNIGLRWDIDTGETERYDRLSVIDLYVKSPLADKVGLPLKGGYLFAGDDQSLGRRSVRPTDYKKFNPRFGIAYQFNPRTTIRTAYGIFFGQSDFSAGKLYTGQTFRTTTIATPAFENGLPRETASNVYSTFGYNVPVGTSQGLLSQYGVGNLESGYPEALASNYNQNWNFTIQRGLGKDIVLEVAYAGNKGTHTAADGHFGQLDPQYLSLGDKLLELIPNPMFGIIPGQNPTATRVKLLSPYPQFNAARVTKGGWGNSNYHALQTRLEKRYSSGLSLMASYTWSKTITDVADAELRLLPSGIQGVRNWYCRACERGLSSYDQPHRFVLNGTYELPIGRGKSFGAGWNKMMDAIFGQWQVNGILTLSAGQPLRFDLADPKTVNAGSGAGQHPDATGINPDLGSKKTIDRWFDTAQYVVPKPYTFGNIAKTDPRLRNDGAQNLDCSLFKNFRFGERAQVQFRAEAFNASNTPLFAAPGTKLGAPNFGVVIEQENKPRQIQMGLKILF